MMHNKETKTKPDMIFENHFWKQFDGHVKGHVYVVKVGCFEIYVLRRLIIKWSDLL